MKREILQSASALLYSQNVVSREETRAYNRDYNLVSREETRALTVEGTYDRWEWLYSQRDDG